MPARVEETLAFVRSHNIWHSVTRNSPATSCKDAASRRIRLGAVGIPLYDELKSLCVAAYLPDSKRTLVLLHCRANARFDLEAAGRILGVSRPLARLSGDELKDRLNTEYGTVNPFSEADQFIHVFDSDVCSEYTAPHTMMTNAGDLTWGLEFTPSELIEGLRDVALDVVIGKITEDDYQKANSVVPAFGILTGNGPDSGIALWQQINTRINERLSASGRMRGDLSYPRVLVESMPEMGLSMQLVDREEIVWQTVESGIGRLIDGGATHLAVACNTTQYYSERLKKICLKSGVVFVDIQTLLIDYIKSRKMSSITLIGIPVVANMGEYSGYKELKKLGVKSVDERVFADILEVGYMVKKLQHQKQDSRSLNKLRHVIKSGVSTEWIILALTELSVLVSRFPKITDEIGGKKIIDTLGIYGHALADMYVDSIPTEREHEDAKWI